MIGGARLENPSFSGRFNFRQNCTSCDDDDDVDDDDDDVDNDDDDDDDSISARTALSS